MTKYDLPTWIILGWAIWFGATYLLALFWVPLLRPRSIDIRTLKWRMALEYAGEDSYAAYQMVKECENAHLGDECPLCTIPEQLT